MKKLLFIFSFSILLAGNSIQCQKIHRNIKTVLINAAPITQPLDTLYYYIIAGQSNAAGRVIYTNWTAPYAGKIKTATHTAFTKNSALNPGSFDTLETGTNTSDQVGYSAGQPNLGYDLINYKNRDVYFIQSALGGQAITAWDVGQYLGDWLDSSITLVQSRAITAGKRSAFKGMIWIQGETGGGGDTATYHSKCNALFARIRAEANTPNLPIYIVQMKDCQTGVSSLGPLQDVQASIGAQTNNVLVGKTDTPPNSCQDNLHFDFLTQAAIWTFIFNLIKDL